MTTIVLRLCRLMSRFRQFIANIVLPFATIARELRRMNDLTELALANRLNPKTGELDPVIPITEVPGRNDTEIFFGEEPAAHGKARMRRELQRQWEGEMPDDDDNEDNV